MSVPLAYTKCGEDHLGVISVDASEYPVKAGHIEGLKMTFKPDQTIKGGTVELTIRKFGKDLYGEKLDLCHDLSLDCPVMEEEVVTAVVNEKIPSDVPPVKATARVTIVDGSDQQLACIELPIQVVKVTPDGPGYLTKPFMLTTSES